MAGELDDMHLAAWAWACLGYTRTLLRDGAAAIEAGEAGLSIAARHHLPRWVGFNREIRAWGQLLEGDVEAAVTGMLESHALIRSTGARLHTSRTAMFLADGYLRLGRLEQAKRHLDEARHHWRDFGESYCGAEIERLEALLAAAGNAPGDTVIERLQRARTIAGSQSARLFEMRACVEPIRRGRDEVRDPLARLVDAVSAGTRTESGALAPDLVDARRLLNG